MKYTKSFHLFWRAVKSTRHEMWVSLQVLIVITLILSLALFLVEHNAQPDVFTNYWDAFLWSTMGYIDDPGEFATYTPITFWGRVLKIACALVNIAIFAVPAGLIAGGFSDAIAEDKREKELQYIEDRLSKAFRRILVKDTDIRVVPRYVSFTSIMVNRHIDTKDILEAVRNSNRFRLFNLAAAMPPGEKTDRIVIDLIPKVGETEYGCFIDRGSNVTIVSCSSYLEVGISSFAFYLALFGGFNYISKEYEENVDERQSFYKIAEKDIKGRVKDFISDVRKLSRGKEKWTIFIISANPVHPEQLHFVTSLKNGEGDRISTVIDKETFSKMFDEMSKEMKEKFNLESETDTRYKSNDRNNIAFHIHGGTETNAFTLRMDWGVTAFGYQNKRIVLEMAKILSETLAGKPIEYSKAWEDPGFDYDYNK